MTSHESVYKHYSIKSEHKITVCLTVSIILKAVVDILWDQFMWLGKKNRTKIVSVYGMNLECCLFYLTAQSNLLGR